MLLASDILHKIENTTGISVTQYTAIARSGISEVYGVHLADGSYLVAKVGPLGSSLAVESYMLTYLRNRTRLPVPEVFYADERLLLMTYVLAGDHLNANAQCHAAELLADLHETSAEAYGFERDTLIGSLHQPNPFSHRWIDFFRDQRLLFMGTEAMRVGRLPLSLYSRLEKFAARLTTWLEESSVPSLIHGDVWSGNVLCRRGRIAAFIDPAIYYADAELAFSMLFGTFETAFFRRYGEIRPLRPGFFEERKDIYNLYPLLVHVRLFGGSYASSVDRILRQFGY
ncbi:Ribulosamine/erythrulosamine 3-kinase potentially involved in protein deglycation [invertebrate metagenome]|uniref:Ribulosamine/erythrulosamine 3-kinase potentially involved in protein deglycation n=1 Tax=invertebrate metagenome TaxID=1711999 RepID=A0A484H4J3_9ZZZZ